MPNTILKSKIKSALTLAVLSQLIVGIAGCTKKEKKIEGMIELSSEFQKTLKPQAVLYVIARPAGVTSGPPIAVKRFTQPFSFPIEFNLTQQDVMIPETPFEGQMAITARIAQTGSASPANPGDVEGTAQPNPVQVGSGKFRIELNQLRK
jgi:hypothetical protein